MVSRDQRNPIVLQKVRKQGIKFCHDSPKSKETKNKILAQVNTKDSGKRSFVTVHAKTSLVYTKIEINFFTPAYSYTH